MLKRIGLFVVLVSLFAFQVSAKGNTSELGERERKLKKLSNISTRLCEYRSSNTKEFSKAVERLTKKLDKIKLAASRLKTQGRDVSGLETLIATAETQVAVAKTAAPSDFTCPVLASTSDAKSVAQSALNDLKTKLEAYKTALRAANKAVEEAGKALRLVISGGETRE